MFFRIIRNSGDSPRDKFLIVVAYMLAVIFAIVLHEVAHGFVAYLNGDDTAKRAGRLTLNPIKHLTTIGLLAMLLIGLGWAKPVPVDIDKFKNRKVGLFTVSISGVLTNLITGLISYGFLIIIYTNAKLPTSSEILDGYITFSAYFFSYFAVISFALMAFNLLPFFPLDGFNVLASVLKPENKLLIFLKKYGSIILLILVFGGSLLSSISPYLDPLGLYMNAIINGILKQFNSLIAV